MIEAARPALGAVALAKAARRSLAPPCSRPRKTGALLLGLLLVCCGSLQAQARLDTLLASGPTASRINLVVLSEGYTPGDLTRFLDDARAMVDYLLETEPYRTYRGYFNAFALSVPSLQSGSDHPGRGQFRDTYFNSSYDSYGISYLLTIPPNDRDSDPAHGEGRVMALLEQYMPEYDIALLLVNDSEYGGSGGRLAISSLHRSAREIAVHELGHSYALLGDEYESAFPGYPDIEEPNTTRETRREFIKWTAWIRPETPVPTPETAAYLGAVGLFEGAHYHATGWYRPKQSCKMRVLGQSFCEVCAEAIVLAGYRLVDPLDSFQPAAPLLNVSNAPVTFLVSVLEPADAPLALQWSVNGFDRPGETNTHFQLDPATLPPGTNQVQVRAHDPTPLVRSDPDRLLEGQHAWIVVRDAAVPEFRLTAAVALAEEMFLLEVPPTSGARVVIESSSDAVHWRDVHTNEGHAAFVYTNALAPGPAGQFYRARSEP